MTRPIALALALAAGGLFAADAPAQVFAPDLFTGATTVPGATSLAANHWYNWYSLTQAGAQADLEGSAQHLTGTRDALAARSQASASSGAKSAAATANLSATSLHASASANDSADATSTLSGGVAIASIGYVAFLDAGAPVRMDLHLNGTLAISGDRLAMLPDPTRAGVAAVAVGSLAGGDNAAYLALFQSIGIGAPLAEGEALVAQLATWPTTDWLVPPQQPHIASFGRTVLADPFDNPTAVDRRLSVFADGTPVDCPPDVVLSICGKYLFSFQISLVAGAQNGGIADFSHSLTVDALHLAPGQTLEFADGQAIPLITASVPEPASAALALVGLAGLVAQRRRQRAAQLRSL